MSPIRTLIHIVWGPGQHRRPTFNRTLLFDEQNRDALLDPRDLEALIEDGEVEPIEEAWCPAEQATRPHALHTDGSRTCFECQHTTEDGQ